MIAAILADAVTHGAATQPNAAVGAGAGSTTAAYLFLAALSVPGLIALTQGAFRPRRVIGPNRAAPFASLLHLAAIFFFALFVLVTIRMVYFSWAHPHATSQTVPTDIDLAFLSTVPAILTVALILLCDRRLGGATAVKTLGESPTDIPRGVLYGLIGAMIAIPLSLWTMQLAQMLFQAVHYSHPMEHPLLPAMAVGPMWSRVLNIIAAVIIVPIFEEILFRGHLQTLLRSTLIRFSARAGGAGAGGGTGTTPAARGSSVILEYRAGSEGEGADAHIRPWHSWVAIVVTSALFASIHPGAWMMPAIFVLSLCLGYAYERTGLIWTNITMHALFNAVGTALYLSMFLR